MTESLVALRDRRDQVIARLSDGFAHDLFDDDELGRRLDLAHAARTVADLDALVADLGASVPSTALVPVGAQAITDPNRPPDRRLRVWFSGVERKGAWLVPQTLRLGVAFGSAELDFREASLGAGVTTIDVGVTFGSLEIKVPPHLAIDVDVSSVFGSVEQVHRAAFDPDPTRPMLRIVGSVRFGSLEIETRLPGETRRQARKREKREQKQLRSGKGM